MYINKVSFFSIAIFLCILSCVLCVPVDVTGKNINFYKLTPNEGSGNYNFNYGTRDGAERSERGFIKKEPGSDRPLLVVTGTFKYPDSEGEMHEVSYIADEQGYRIVTKEEIEKLQKELPNEILPPEVPQQQGDSNSPVLVNTTAQPLYSISFLASSSSVPPPTGLQSRSRLIPSLPPTPAPESNIIKLKVIKPPSNDKQNLCPPGKCSGNRQSKIYKIKSLKIT